MITWLDTGATVLRYEVTGSGPPVILIHEMGGSLHSWEEVAPELARHCRVLRYDGRGAGLSEKMSATPSLDDLAGDLARLRAATGFDGPAALVGTAVGAAIALRHAITAPAQAACIVGFSPVTACPDARRAAVEVHADRIEHEGLRVLEAAAMESVYPPALRRDAAVYDQARARWLANDPRSFAAIYRMFARLEMAEEYGAVRTPCLMVGAPHDGLRPPAAVRDVAGRIPGARYVELPTGHVASVQTPELVCETVLGFMAETGHLPR